MKHIIIFIICLSVLFSCTGDNSTKDCPKEIEENKFCDLFNEAKWYFYSSNSHGGFEYIDTITKKKVCLPNILSIDLQLFKWKEYNDTIEFIIFPDKKYDLTSISQSINFSIFGFNKNTGKLIYRETGNTVNSNVRANGYVFNKNDKVYNYIDSVYKNNPNHTADMRYYGLYPINEQDSILIVKLNSQRKRINPWLINYAKQKGYIQ